MLTDKPYQMTDSLDTNPFNYLLTEQNITMNDTPRTDIDIICEDIARKLNDAFNLYAWDDSKAHAKQIVMDGIKSLETELGAVTEQLNEAHQKILIRKSNNLRLDRINREHQEFIEHLKKLSGAREQDIRAMREMATKVCELTEQRDRLAEALERIKDYQGRFGEDDPTSIATEALQSLNPDHTGNANDMIAAMKGGSDE